MTSSDRTGITDAVAIAEHQFMQRAEHEEQEHEAALRRGITDEAAVAEYQFMHRAEQEEHEHEAAAKRGLPDEAAEWEYDLIHGAEVNAIKSQDESRAEGQTRAEKDHH
ncbi:hypothetical protein DL765_005434 [Monosporascus sp. GIB2]|nr:hypothetical protein DL765_005434 [Monosporascus sp. GIB2]